MSRRGSASHISLPLVLAIAQLGVYKCMSLETQASERDAKAGRQDSVFGRECRLMSRSLLRYEGQDVSLARCQVNGMC
jgi:hypothetical protein